MGDFMGYGITDQMHPEHKAWFDRNFPRFAFSLDMRTVEVEGADDIHTVLQQRGYKYQRSSGAWTQRFKSKKAALRELYWVRRKGHNGVGEEKRDGRHYRISLTRPTTGIS